MKIRFADLVTRRGFVAAVGALTGGGLASVATAQTAAAKPADAGSSKVAVIDFQGAIAGSAEGKAGIAQLQSQFAPQNAELQTISKQINDASTKLSTGVNTLSDEEKMRLQNQINQLQQSGTRKKQDLDDDTNAAEQDLVQTIGPKLQQVVDKYAQDNGYTLVLDGGAQTTIVVYAADSLNITQAIISAYDSTHMVKASGSTTAPSSTPRTTPSTSRPSTGTTPKPQ